MKEHAFNRNIQPFIFNQYSFLKRTAAQKAAVLSDRDLCI
jgi:hypothetical protein